MKRISAFPSRTAVTSSAGTAAVMGYKTHRVREGGGHGKKRDGSLEVGKNLRERE